MAQTLQEELIGEINVPPTVHDVHIYLNLFCLTNMPDLVSIALQLPQPSKKLCSR